MSYDGCHNCRHWNIDPDDDDEYHAPKRQCLRDADDVAVVCMSEGGIEADLFTASQFHCRGHEAWTVERRERVNRELATKHLGMYFRCLGYLLTDMNRAPFWAYRPSTGERVDHMWSHRGKQINEALAKAEEFAR